MEAGVGASVERQIEPVNGDAPGLEERRQLLGTSGVRSIADPHQQRDVVEEDEVTTLRRCGRLQRGQYGYA